MCLRGDRLPHSCGKPPGCMSLDFSPVALTHQLGTDCLSNHNSAVFRGRKECVMTWVQPSVSGRVSNLTSAASHRPLFLSFGLELVRAPSNKRGCLKNHSSEKNKNFVFFPQNSWQRLLSAIQGNRLRSLHWESEHLRRVPSNARREWEPHHG